MHPYTGGCNASKYDIRTFKYPGSALAVPVPTEAGERYPAEYIQDQHKVGICTGNAMTMQANRYFEMEFSPEFQYLLQKLEIDRNWSEGSSIFSALKVGQKFGFLPKQYWTYTTEEDRKLPYFQYIMKLKNIPKAEIERLKVLAAPYKIAAYEKVPTDAYSLKKAIVESGKLGLLVRYEIGETWWTGSLLSDFLLQRPRVAISGHAAIDSRFSGESFRVNNGWGPDWADKGTAYRIHSSYRPTEAWMVHYGVIPQRVQQSIESLETLKGQLQALLQKLINLTQK